MAGTKEGFKKARAKIIAERFNGDEEAYKNWRKEVSARGGKNGGRGGFMGNPELARKAGALGGKTSKRKKD